MATLTQLRLAAREIFAESLRAVDAETLVRGAVRREDSVLHLGPSKIEITNRRVYVIAVGKARFPIAYLQEELGEFFAAGVLSGPFPISSGQEVEELKS